MALIRDAGTAWSAPITLTTDEVWQTRSGVAFVTTTADPEADDGLALVLRDGLRIGAGVTLRYRAGTPSGTTIVREAVA